MTPLHILTITLCSLARQDNILERQPNRINARTFAKYHVLRPYITASKIPYFDPRRLPYWSAYEKEGKAEMIQVGGTMAGEFTGETSEIPFVPLAPTIRDFTSWIEWRTTKVTNL
jgi:hypothetical protein